MMQYGVTLVTVIPWTNTEIIGGGGVFNYVKYPLKNLWILKVKIINLKFNKK